MLLKFLCLIGWHDWSMWSYHGRPTYERRRSCHECHKVQKRTVRRGL